jgi:hypothetical protein
MVIPPAVIIHGLPDARAALAPGLPVTLLSASGAAPYAGCLWWQAVVKAARAEFPATEAVDILDCADGSGQAMAALRTGVTRLVLWNGASGRDAVAAIARDLGGFVLPAPPPALDFARRGAQRNLINWLRSPLSCPTGDSSPALE